MERREERERRGEGSLKISKVKVGSAVRRERRQCVRKKQGMAKKMRTKEEKSQYKENRR